MLFEHFPYTDFHRLNDDWILREIRKMSDELEQYVVNNQITFSEPVNWIITGSYAAHMITKDPATDTWYISRKPVPPGILISNGEYWEKLGAFPQAEQSLICNVQDYGVMGVAGADYTTQLQEALDHPEYIAYYFPAGTYSFGTVYTSRPVVMFGAGESTIWKPLHRIATSNQYKTMLQSSGDLYLKNIKFVGNNSIETQTGEKYLQTAMIQQYGHKFRMSGCVIDKIYDTYHLSVGVQEFYDRNGIFLYVFNADSVEIDHCRIYDFGGEELMNINRDPAHYGDAVPVLIHDNKYLDRPTHDNGSSVGCLGGDIYFYNNTGLNHYNAGSHANLFGANVYVFNNTYTSCDMSGWVDTSEGYYCKNNNVVIHDNHVEDANGVMEACIRVQAVYTDIHDNHLVGATAVSAFNINSPSDYSGTLYKPDYITWSEYKKIDIRNNEIITTKQPASWGACSISLGRHPGIDSGSRPLTDEIIIRDNTMKAEYNGTLYNPIAMISKMNKMEIIGNIFKYVGAGTPTSGRKVIVSIAEPVPVGFRLTIENNTIIDDQNTAFVFISGTQNNLQNSNILACFNSIVSSSLFKILLSNTITPASVVGDYNFNFSGLTG